MTDNESILPADTDEVSKLPHPPYFHEKEVDEAIRAINLVAVDRNPFTEAPLEKLRPENKDSLLKALCIVVSALAYCAPKPKVEGKPQSPAQTLNDVMISKRPLEEYLNALEREAILEALKEAEFNRTAAAKLLGITFRSLRYRLESLGIEEERNP